MQSQYDSELIVAPIAASNFYHSASLSARSRYDRIMAIGQLTEIEFVDVLQRYISPSAPIDRVQALKGRADQVAQIERAFHSPGRQVFIHGDRGVGKSSLALAVANHLSAEGKRPIQIACNRGTAFALIRTACAFLLGESPMEKADGKRGKVGFGVPGFSAELETGSHTNKIPELQDLNQAVAVFRHCVDSRSGEAVLIFDEFDALSTNEDREIFADFIKQVGDQKIAVKLFFTGIGRSLEDLLAAHHSCYRYLANVALEPLGWDGRLSIVDAAAEALGLTVEASTKYRICAISDGFPHYVHLITEKLLWAANDDHVAVSQTTPAHYLKALTDAVKDIEPFLKELYETATQKYANDYQEILWAVADHHELKRRSADIYQSYLDIMRQRTEQPMDRSKFNARMNYLKAQSHGEILIGSRQGWYELREPILRGYIRLRAEAEGIELAREHPRQSDGRSLSLFTR